MPSKKNTTTGLLLAAAAGGVAYFLTRKKAKASPAVSPDEPDEPVGPDEPFAPPPDAPSGPTGPAAPSSTVPSGVVGGGWVWPEKDRWPHEGSIGHSLMVAGYNVDEDWAMGPPQFTMTSTKHQSVVKQFQRDYNAVQGSLPAGAVCVPGSAIGKSRPNKLSVDGWIGPQTWRAMRWVFKHAAPPSGGGSLTWKEIVSCAKEMS